MLAETTVPPDGACLPPPLSGMPSLLSVALSNIENTATRRKIVCAVYFSVCLTHTHDFTTATRVSGASRSSHASVSLLSLVVSDDLLVADRPQGVAQGLPATQRQGILVGPLARLPSRQRIGAVSAASSGVSPLKYTVVLCHTVEHGSDLASAVPPPN